MYEIYENLHKDVISITKDMESCGVDEKEMFELIQALDHQFEQAVKMIHRLETLIIAKEMENYSIR